MDSLKWLAARRTMTLHISAHPHTESKNAVPCSCCVQARVRFILVAWWEDAMLLCDVCLEPFSTREALMGPVVAIRIMAWSGLAWGWLGSCEGETLGETRPT